MHELLADVEARFDDWFQGKLPFTFQGLRWSPSTDVYETGDEYHVTMALPGLSIEDLNVRFENDTLQVRGIRRERCSEQRRFHKMEIPVGAFERRIRVPRPIKSDEIKVSYQNGLLEITLPKESAQRVEIPIE